MANDELKRACAMLARKRVVNTKWVMVNVFLCAEGTLRTTFDNAYSEREREIACCEDHNQCTELNGGGYFKP